MRASDGWSGLPMRVWKAKPKFRKERLELKGSIPYSPLERSPRQCIAPELVSPRNVWVVNGPFIGWKSVGRLLPLIGVETPVPPVAINTLSSPPKLIGIGLWVTALSGFPKSQ